MSRSEGFSLVEVVVALVVFSVGLLGVAGILATAAHTLNDARVLQWAAAAAGEVADSLAHSGVAGSGERSDSRGRIIWSVVAGEPLALVTLEARRPEAAGREGEVLLRASALVPPSPEGLP